MSTKRWSHEAMSEVYDERNFTFIHEEEVLSTPVWIQKGIVWDRVKRARVTHTRIVRDARMHVGVFVYTEDPMHRLLLMELTIMSDWTWWCTLSLPRRHLTGTALSSAWIGRCRSYEEQHVVLQDMFELGAASCVASVIPARGPRGAVWKRTKYSLFRGVTCWWFASIVHTSLPATNNVSVPSLRGVMVRYAE
jgi:hypothetical protein